MIARDGRRSRCELIDMAGTLRGNLNDYYLARLWYPMSNGAHELRIGRDARGASHEVIPVSVFFYLFSLTVVMHRIAEMKKCRRKFVSSLNSFLARSFFVSL